LVALGVAAVAHAQCRVESGAEVVSDITKPGELAVDAGKDPVERRKACEGPRRSRIIPQIDELARILMVVEAADEPLERAAAGGGESQLLGHLGGDGVDEKTVRLRAECGGEQRIVDVADVVEVLAGVELVARYRREGRSRRAPIHD